MKYKTFSILGLALITVSLLTACGSEEKTNSGVSGVEMAKGASTAVAEQFTSIAQLDDQSRRFCHEPDSNHTCLMNMTEAKQYCRSIGAHLPSAREWAHFAISLGATGIRETEFPEERWNGALSQELDRMRADGYDVILRKRTTQVMENRILDTDKVDFYFNSTGYQKPGSPDGVFWVANSAHNSFDSYRYAPGHSLFMFVNAQTEANWHHRRPVRCVMGLEARKRN